MLYESGRAMLPGFGEWILERVPARIHPEEALIYPPRVHVHFTYHPDVDATPFIQFIASWQNIIPAVAELQMKKSLLPLEEQLSRGEPVEIPLVGTLQRDEQGEWMFIASADLEEGLEALPVRPLSRAGTVLQKPETTETPQEIAPLTESELTPEEILEPIEDRPSGGMGWWIALGVVLILIAAGWTAWDKGWIKTLEKKIWGDTVAAGSPAVQQPADSASQGVSGAGVDSVKTYQLVVTAFTDSLQAMNFYRQLSSQWPNAELIRDSASNQYLVALSMSITAADTAKWVEQIQQIYGGHPYFVQH